jgi:predicted ATPase
MRTDVDDSTQARGRAPIESLRPHEFSITTPDRRVRVFVSSTLEELSADRHAAREAITRLHLTPVMFEIGARTHPARDLYRAYLDQSDVFVGIYGETYGWVAPTETVSGLEDEYALSGDRPKLIYVKTVSHRDDRLSALLARIRLDDRVAYKHYENAEDLVDLLADDLAVLLTERFTRRDAAPEVTASAVPIPTPTSAIVGRESEIEQVLALASDPAVRLITLIGPGGIGKTRLALEIARLAREGNGGHPRAVSFIDLGAVHDPDRWEVSVASSLGIHSEGTRPMLDILIDRLRDRELLLVVDNVEQLVSAANDLAQLLADCPGVTVLVTSRIALRIRGEHEVPLAPLRIPDGSISGDLTAIADSPAVRLLTERAQQVRPQFAVTAANAKDVAELCRLLDGIPLALELAAAQLRLLTPAALVRRLSAVSAASLDLSATAIDAPARQRTLRATIEWSHSLLGEAERALFARLSVFVGAWTLEAMSAVGTEDDDLDPVDVLTTLLTHSLVRTDDTDPDEPRFRMLETIRTYASERLSERGEVESTVSRLTHYLFGLVMAVRDDLQGAGHLAASTRLDRERDEIVSAVNWALRNDDAEAVGRLLTPLFTYWWSRGLLPMTNELAEKAAALPSAALLDTYGTVLLSGARGMSLIMVGQVDAAEPLLIESLQGATEIGNDRLRAYALLGLGGASGNRDVRQAGERLDEAAAVFLSIGDDWGLALSLSTRGGLLLVEGDAAAASAMHVAALAAATSIQNGMLRAQILGMLGLDAMGSDDVASARQFYAQAAALHKELQDYEGSAYCLLGMADVAFYLDRPDAAARLLGSSQHARDVIGAAVWPGFESTNDSQRERVRDRLGGAAFDELMADGASMPISAALDYGLAATDATSLEPGGP